MTPFLSFQPHSPHSRFHPPFLKGEYQEVPWIPGVGSMPIPKTGIQPRLMGGRDKTEQASQELTDGFCGQKGPERSKTTVSEKEGYRGAKLSFRAPKNPGFPGNRLRGCQVTTIFTQFLFQ